MKDSIDFGAMNVGRLFRKLFIPTLMGMVFSIIFIITDGIFVGKGIGSDALASINITSPIFLLVAGISMMFGIGASVVASVHLAHRKIKVARINITQALLATSLLIIGISILILLFSRQFSSWLGATERLLPYTVEYINWFCPFLVFSAIMTAGMFYIRLDGSPKYAMMCNVTAAVINIILDFVFIFIMGLGMFGAALATSLGYIVGCLLTLTYLFSTKHSLHVIRYKSSWKSFKLTVRNIVYMCRMGFSTFVNELSVATMMFMGNTVFIKYLAEDGVAAFSVSCYLYPIIFMVCNAIALSVQPILSFNYGVGNAARVKSAFRISLVTAVVCGILVLILFYVFNCHIVSLFIRPDNTAYLVAVQGQPLFATGFVFLGINVVSIGYFQSLEQDRTAILITLLRGIVFTVLCFLFIPRIWGVPGIWLAVPVAEFLTVLLVSVVYYFQKDNQGRQLP